MIRARRLQVLDEKGRWRSEAYAIDTPKGEVKFNYPFWWEHIGGRYAHAIQESGLPLERVEQILSAPKLKWLPVETLDMTYEAATEMLDRECHIPTPRKVRARAA